MKKTGKVWIVLVALLVGIAACDSDDNFDPGTPPEVPPLESMVMDVENFLQGETNSSGRVNGQLNWTSAALQVGFWNVILAVNLAVPVAAFGATINETAEYDRERSVWVWTKEYDFVGRTYTSELTGAIVADQVEWKMYISQENGFENVLWYTGIMKLDGTSGSWTLGKNAENLTNYLGINWSKENEEVGSIRYEVIEQGSDDIGSYIEYGRTDDTDYNVYYTVVLTKEDKSAEIEWNDITGAGRVEYNNSGEYLCWDENFEDVECE